MPVSNGPFSRMGVAIAITIGAIILSAVLIWIIMKIFCIQSSGSTEKDCDNEDDTENSNCDDHDRIVTIVHFVNEKDEYENPDDIDTSISSQMTSTMGTEVDNLSHLQGTSNENCAAHEVLPDMTPAVGVTPAQIRRAPSTMSHVPVAAPRIRRAPSAKSHFPVAAPRIRRASSAMFHDPIAPPRIRRAPTARPLSGEKDGSTEEISGDSGSAQASLESQVPVLTGKPCTRGSPTATPLAGEAMPKVDDEKNEEEEIQIVDKNLKIETTKKEDVRTEESGSAQASLESQVRPSDVDESSDCMNHGAISLNVERSQHEQFGTDENSAAKDPSFGDTTTNTDTTSNIVPEDVPDSSKETNTEESANQEKSNKSSANTNSEEATIVDPAEVVANRTLTNASKDSQSRTQEKSKETSVKAISEEAVSFDSREDTNAEPKIEYDEQNKLNIESNIYPEIPDVEVEIKEKSTQKQNEYVNDQEINVCTQCKTKFKMFNNLEEHIFTYHRLKPKGESRVENIDNEVVEVSIMSETFSSQQPESRNDNEKEKPFYCTYCEKGFRKMNAFTQHLFTKHHLCFCTIEKEYNLSSKEQKVFPKELMENSNVPLREKTEIKKYSCNKCTKRIGQYQDLQAMEQHLKKEHNYCFCLIDMNSLLSS